ELTESCSIHCAYYSRWLSIRRDFLLHPSVLYGRFYGDLLNRDAFIPTQRNRAREWIMLEIDRVCRQPFTGLAKNHFIIQVFGKGLGLSRDQLAQRSGLLQMRQVRPPEERLDGN